MILYIFLPNFGEKMAALNQIITAVYGGIISYLTLIFKKIATNWSKSPKIILITMNPGDNPTTSEFTATAPALKSRLEYFLSKEKTLCVICFVVILYKVAVECSPRACLLPALSCAEISLPAASILGFAAKSLITSQVCKQMEITVICT
jgi:hypothetical protein